MKKERMFLETYVPPIISVEEVKLEGGIASGSTRIEPGNEAGVIVIDGWEDGGNEGSALGDSRW